MWKLLVSLHRYLPGHCRAAVLHSAQGICHSGDHRQQVRHTDWPPAGAECTATHLVWHRSWTVWLQGWSSGICLWLRGICEIYTYMAIIDIHCCFIWAVCLSMCACVRVFLQESITIVNASTYPFESGDGKSHNCKGNLWASFLYNANCKHEGFFPLQT